MPSKLTSSAGLVWTQFAHSNVPFLEGSTSSVWLKCASRTSWELLVFNQGKRVSWNTFDECFQEMSFMKYTPIMATWWGHCSCLISTGGLFTQPVLPFNAPNDLRTLFFQKFRWKIQLLTSTWSQNLVSFWWRQHLYEWWCLLCSIVCSCQTTSTLLYNRIHTPLFFGYQPKLATDKIFNLTKKTCQFETGCFKIGPTLHGPRLLRMSTCYA